MGIKLIIGVGGGIELGANTAIRLNTYNYKLRNCCIYWESENLYGTGINFYPNIIASYKRSIVFRNVSSIGAGVPKSKIVVHFDGNFNYDTFTITIPETFTGRVEVRNDDNVLITDNGLPWGDGTYPPDAKNRARLSGLHAAPAVINPELETALMGMKPIKRGN